MKRQESPVRSIILSKNRDDEIVIRPKREHEWFPSHTPVRILVDRTIHLVQGCEVMRLEMSLTFKPERNWKKCPYCKKTKWSVWMPVPIQIREVWDEKDAYVYTNLTWYILCLHCATIVAHRNDNPYGLSDVKEYIYDPADDVHMKLYPDPPPKRQRKSSTQK